LFFVAMAYASADGGSATLASAVPDGVLVEGEGGMQKVVIKHASGASAEVYLFGGTLTSWKTADGKERIFVSPGAIYDGKKAIRGGVPLVFPQFGQPEPSMPQHGFVRNSMWNVVSVSETDDTVVAKFTINSSDATKEKWPHAFALCFAVTVGVDTLSIALEVMNSGDNPFTFQTLLHTYFMIPDIADVVVCGLTGKTYIDKVKGGEKVEESEEKIELPSFTDRIYLGSGGEPVPVVIASKDGTPIYEIVNMASMGPSGVPCDVVVWNPYEEASPGDLPPPAFKNFVCVEPGLVQDFYGLPPGKSATIAQSVKAL